MPTSRLRPRRDPAIAISRALLAKGKTMTEIAGVLRISYKTVANNCTHLRQKLGARSAMDLMRIAIDSHLG
jgi:two-component system invasion response regulator UvrY